MNKRSEFFLVEINKLIIEGQELTALGNSHFASNKINIRLTSWTTRTGEFISKLFPKTSNYQIKYDLLIKQCHGYSFQHIALNFLFDFLEMSEYLLKEKYKDAAAVIIGSVLENSLRKLAQINNIQIFNNKGKYLTIEPLNIELAKNDVYNQLIRKQISTWADLRNSAAHGNYNEYDSDQVELMLEFTQKFASDYLN